MSIGQCLAERHQPDSSDAAEPAREATSDEVDDSSLGGGGRRFSACSVSYPGTLSTQMRARAVVLGSP
jgi:hypothetical protein